jgi:putative aminopeptidase FrvX
VPVHFAFSVQEEVGLRGAHLLARRYPLDMAFAVDTTSTADWPEVDSSLASARIGEGAALRVLDNASVIPTGFRKELTALAEAEGIPLQTVFSGGGTDVRPFQTEGPQVMSLAFPVRYTHSAVELVHADDVGAVIDLICAITRKYA